MSAEIVLEFPLAALALLPALLAGVAIGRVLFLRRPSGPWDVLSVVLPYFGAAAMLIASIRSVR